MSFQSPIPFCREIHPVQSGKDGISVRRTFIRKRRTVAKIEREGSRARKTLASVRKTCRLYKIPTATPAEDAVIGVLKDFQSLPRPSQMPELVVEGG
jgi:hypothetical protein